MMNTNDSHLFGTTNAMASAEARERLQTIMSSDMAEAIEQIGQTLEACHTKKTRLLDRLDEVYQAVEAVRNECGCIDTTIGTKVLHLNKLATHIVQQMARVHIPDPPPLPPIPEPLPPPTVEIDLSTVHERLNGLDHMVNDLTKLILEKEETVLYVIKNRPGKGELATTARSSVRSGGVKYQRDESNVNQVNQFQALVRSIQDEDEHRVKEVHQQKVHLRHRRAKPVSNVALSAFVDEEETSDTNGQRNGHDQTFDEDDGEETSGSSEQTTVGPCTLCLQERTEDMTTKQSVARLSVASSNYTDRSHSAATMTAKGAASSGRRGLGEALASNGTEIAYYDYEQKLIRTAGGEDYSIKFEHGLVVDLFWWSLNNEWLILSEQGLYRWKPEETDYHDAYEFTNGEIGFRRIAVTGTSIFCLFRYSLMLLELSNSMQMKRLHALAPPEARYRKLADISIRKLLRSDGSEEDVLGLIWFGSGSGILLEERFVTPLANNIHERLFRHVAVRQGRYARLAAYDNGRAWLISYTGEDAFWIVDNANVVAGRWEATATWVKVESGTPINAVGYGDSTVCIRLEDGRLEYLASAH